MCLPNMSISSSVPSEQGGITLSPSTLPPSPRTVSFIWNDFVESLLPSSAPFQIMVGINKLGIRRSIVDEGSSTSILSSSAWKYLCSLKILSATSELFYFNRRASECLRNIPQLLIMLGGKTLLVNLLVVPVPLDFNFILGHDYEYAMNVCCLHSFM